MKFRQDLQDEDDVLCDHHLVNHVHPVKRMSFAATGAISEPPRSLEPRMHTNQHEFHREQIRVNLCPFVVEKQCPVLTRPISDRGSDP